MMITLKHSNGFATLDVPVALRHYFKTDQTFSPSELRKKLRLIRQNTRVLINLLPKGEAPNLIHRLNAIALMNIHISDAIANLDGLPF